VFRHAPQPFVDEVSSMIQRCSVRRGQLFVRRHLDVVDGPVEPFLQIVELDC